MTYHFITDEEIAYANSINMVELAKAKGYTLKQVGKSYKIEGCSGVYVNSDGQRWNAFADEKGGGGPIQFLMHLENKTWLQAVTELLANPFCLAPKATKSEPKEKASFALPEKNKTFKHMYAYLIQRRGIDKEIIHYFVNAKKLYENTMKSCVFVGYNDENQPAFASFRSTSDSKMRGCIVGSSKQFVFAKEGENGNLFVFESAIDLMSYLSLIKMDNSERISVDKNHYISLDGVSGLGLDHYLIKHPQIDSIYLCLDNDEAGNKASYSFGKLYRQKYRMIRYTPAEGCKDWNDRLCMIKQCREEVAMDEPEQDLER